MTNQIKNLYEEYRRIARCETVSFDACDTLIFARPGLDETLNEACRALGIPMNIERARAFCGAMVGAYTDRMVEALQREENLSGEEKRAAWKSVFLAAQGAPIQNEEELRGLENELAKFNYEWTAASDAADTLHAIRDSGRRIVVTSNFDNTLEDVLRGVGLTKLTDAILPSAEAGVEKPDPRIFDYSLKKVNARPETTIHIGDSAFDVISARAAGATGILLDHVMPGWSGDMGYMAPVVRIEKLSRLLKLLGI